MFTEKLELKQEMNWKGILNLLPSDFNWEKTVKKNLTQSELADLVEKKREYLSKIENKRILISSELIINNEIKVLRQLPPVPIM